MKDSNKKRILKGEPLLYKTKQGGNYQIPYAYHSKVDQKYYVRGLGFKEATQKNMMLFRKYFLKYKNEMFKKYGKLDLELCINLARNDLGA